MDNDYKPKVVFTFVKAGMGHVTPATEIYEAFMKKYGDKCNVCKSYIFSESTNPAVQKLGVIQDEHVKKLSTSKVYNKLEGFSYCLGSPLTLFGLDFFYRKGRKPFYKDLQEINPDLLVSTYYLPSHLARQSNEKGFTNTLIATFSPDPYIYPAWDRKCDLFFVNNEGAYNQALKKGFDKEKLVQVPFVIRSHIKDTKLNCDKQQVKKEFDLCVDKPTVLFSFGAYGTNKTDLYVKALLEKDFPINVVAICGKNKQTYSNLEDYQNKEYKNTNFKLIGYTEQMDKYLLCADLIVGKGGSNSIIEALYMQTPMIVCAQANRLEELTSAYWEKKGVLIRQSNPEKMCQIIEKAIYQKDFLEQYVNNIKKLNVLDNGSEVCADYLYKMLSKRFKNL